MLVRSDQDLRYAKRSTFVGDRLIPEGESMIKVMGELVAYRSNLIEVIANILGDPVQ